MSANTVVLVSREGFCFYLPKEVAIQSKLIESRLNSLESVSKRRKEEEIEGEDESKISVEHDRKPIDFLLRLELQEISTSILEQICRYMCERYREKLKKSSAENTPGEFVQGRFLPTQNKYDWDDPINNSTVLRNLNPRDKIGRKRIFQLLFASDFLSV